MRSVKAVNTSLLCPAGPTPIQTFAILPCGSMRKLLRAAILNPSMLRNEPYVSVTFLSVSESSLNVSPCFSAETLMALLRIENQAQNHGIQMFILRQIALKIMRLKGAAGVLSLG